MTDTFDDSLSLSLRLKSHRGWQSKIDPGPDLDLDPALFHLHAHVGWGGGDRWRQAEDTEAKAAGMDSEQAAWAAHNQLQQGLADRSGPRGPGGQLCPRWVGSVCLEVKVHVSRSAGVWTSNVSGGAVLKQLNKNIILMVMRVNVRWVVMKNLSAVDLVGFCLRASDSWHTCGSPGSLESGIRIQQKHIFPSSKTFQNCPNRTILRLKRLEHVHDRVKSHQKCEIGSTISGVVYYVQFYGFVLQQCVRSNCRS